MTARSLDCLSVREGQRADCRNRDVQRHSEVVLRLLPAEGNFTVGCPDAALRPCYSAAGYRLYPEMPVAAFGGFQSQYAAIQEIYTAP